MAFLDSNVSNGSSSSFLRANSQKYFDSLNEQNRRQRIQVNQRVWLNFPNWLVSPNF